MAQSFFPDCFSLHAYLFCFYPRLLCTWLCRGVIVLTLSVFFLICFFLLFVCFIVFTCLFTKLFSVVLAVFPFIFQAYITLCSTFIEERCFSETFTHGTLSAVIFIFIHFHDLLILYYGDISLNKFRGGRLSCPIHPSNHHHRHRHRHRLMDIVINEEVKPACLSFASFVALSFDF